MDNAKYRTLQSPPLAEPPGSIRPLSKGMGFMDRALTPEEIAAQGWNLLAEDLSLPVAVLCEERLAGNIAWMQQFADAYGAKLAPHGKTTMAPKLFRRQIAAGAWGMTLATAVQTRVAYEHGIRRVLMANQLVGRQNMETISRLLRDPEFEFYCLVDSAELVNVLGAFFQSRKQRLNVLVEVGVLDGRTGIRNSDQLRELTAALARWRESIAVCGVELFEGLLSDEGGVRAFLRNAIDVAYEMAEAKQFDRSPILISGAGSAWFDVVADVLSHADLRQSFEVILRAGCYLTHDVGVYREAYRKIVDRNPVARRMSSSLTPALQLWAYVQSIPEKERAIVSMGKRDAAFDAGLPVPALHYRPGEPAPTAAPAGWQLTKMMDQHAYLKIEAGDNLKVGDMVAFDISHPCLTFDKWRYLPVIDSGYRVIDVVETFF